MKSLRSLAGMSLIEMMVTISILAILIVLGIPSFQQWMLNTRIRSVSDSIQNGLRLARNEAAQRSTYVRFQLNSPSEWQVCALPASAASAAAVTTCTGSTTMIQSFESPNVGTSVLIGTSTLVANLASGTYKTLMTGSVPAGVNFDALGRPSAYGTTSLLRVDVTAANTALQSTSRTLVTTISSGGMVSMCDPQLPLNATTSEGCP